VKFLLVIHYCEPHIGGMETLVAKQAQSLVDLGHDVTIVTCRPTKSVPLQEIKQNGVVIKRFRAINYIENTFGIPFPLIAPQHFIWFLKNLKKYDIVHIHDVFYVSSWMAGIACLLAGKKFYLTQHVGFVDHPSGMVMRIQKAVYRHIGDRLFKKGTKIVVYNTNVRNFLATREKVDDAKIVFNYNGIDTDFFRPVSKEQRYFLRKKYGLPVGKSIILFVGRLVPKKGLHILLDGAENDKTYVVVGSGNLPSKYAERHNIKYFGPAKQEQLRDLYQLSDLFVFPAAGEIFTLVNQEAMACGLPTILADDRGYEDYDVDREHLLFVNRETKAFQKVIENVISDDALLAEMSQYSRETALKLFSWKKNYTREYAMYGLNDRKPL
jgi:D-inositol-3-phosphate glycosyltransferase